MFELLNYLLIVSMGNVHMLVCSVYANVHTQFDFDTKEFSNSINSIQFNLISAHRCPSYQHFLLGRCFKCNTGNCAIMGYHATLPKIQSFNSSENDVIPPDQRDQGDGGNNVSVAPGKYFLATGKEYPFCRKYTLTDTGREKFPFLMIKSIFFGKQNVTIDSQLNWLSRARLNDGYRAI